MLSKQALNMIADNLEEYLNILSTCIILDISHSKSYDKAVSKVEKAISKLRKGKWEGILDPEYVESYKDLLELELKRR